MRGRLVIAGLGAGFLLVALAGTLWLHMTKDQVTLPVTGRHISWVAGGDPRVSSGSTALTGTEATALARAVNASPTFPSGDINCGADYGSKAIVAFQHGQAASTTVTVSLGGCDGISLATADHYDRRSSAKVTRLLAAAAPPGSTL